MPTGPKKTVELAADDAIVIHGAREHNLKNLSVTIPRGKFVVITGVSGSGKSTLAFDTIFAEGQRRFLDSMNAYARQFVEQLARPDVDLIAGLPPTVSIEQRNSSGGGKSTVATVTEIHHFIRLLFARLGTTYCPDCQIPVQAQTRDALGKHLTAETKERGDLLLLAPVVRNRKGFHTEVGEWAARHGFKEVRADGKMYSTREQLRLDRFREHDIEIVLGVLEAGTRKTAARKRESTVMVLRESAERIEPATAKSPQQLIDSALQIGHGTLFALDNHGRVTVHSTERACPKCSRSFELLDPKNFSYNSSQGWCPKCRGFGELFYLPEDVDRGARADAIEESWFGWQEGKREPCPECHGARLNPVARAVRLDVALLGKAPSSSAAAKLQAKDSLSAVGRGRGPGRGGSSGAGQNKGPAPTVETVSGWNVGEALDYFGSLTLDGNAGQIARDILPEIRERLRFLAEVGLGYLQLGRSVTTLSGGEGQRIRLAAQLGSNLSGVLYVLDEPTIGLHARDNEQLLESLTKLRSRGNSLIVVEHDEETMRRADFVIDLGPGAGVNGGQVIASGTLKELLKHPESLTGQCLREKRTFPARGQRREVTQSGRNATPSLTLHHASVNNLKNIDVTLPLGRFIVVTGVSGSGKSTMVRECLLPALQEAVKHSKRKADPKRKDCHVTDAESIGTVHEVDQSPIGRTPRSIPATYVGFFDEIRKIFAQLPEARLRGYGPGRFSFNSPAGRCPECEGAGTIKLEMNFLPPAYVKCESCNGLRFNRETLDIQYAGKNVAEVLDLSVGEGIVFFESLPRIKRPLEALRDTGLDYIKLGQISPTLSGGEAQRVKLVTHLLSGLKSTDRIHYVAKKNFFILEEPSIGLHMSDVKRLVEVIQRL
ncbi:MAG TPA: excinuclease ABC subunit A, partial [Roseimicrobium sp.]|nr:excinuclease ABC subunit A [Roseimicrobium sp.]